MSPRVQAFVEELNKRGGEDWLFAEIAARKSPRKIAAELNASAATFYEWVNSDKARLQSRLEEARVQAADVAAEEAGEVLDQLAGPVTSAEVQLANSKSKWLQWLAASYNRAMYGTGQQQQVNVQVSLGVAHLQALMEGGTRNPEVIPAQVVEAELLPAANDEEVVEA